MTRQAALALAQQVQQGAEQGDDQQNGQLYQHHPSTSDYESENCCSGSSAAGSTLSRQSTIGTINSFDEGIPDDSNSAGGSGLLMFAGHAHFHGCHEQLPSFDSQLSQASAK